MEFEPLHILKIMCLSYKLDHKFAAISRDLLVVSEMGRYLKMPALQQDVSLFIAFLGLFVESISSLIFFYLFVI